ncbi:MAG: DMT family transporter [Aquabacterium sp.]|uniref:DMT family transporter n=1 Tax=Aquabacterium sp. TaxID=1872578 RepID=UPI00120FC8AA|nr:MAG: DMT family transporter [Aquabacterium sp.]
MLTDVLICIGSVLVLVSTLPHMNNTKQVTFALQGHHWWPRVLGLMAVMLFAMTLPMTRLANGSLSDPQWPPLFVASARAALAGVLAMAHLLWVRAAWPERAHRPWLLGVVLGGVMAFPLGMGWAVRIVPASHAAVITGLLPLCTAALAAWWLGHRPRLGFWLASLAGALVMGVFAWTSSSKQATSAHLTLLADGALVLGMMGASVAYVAGARLARQMPSAQVMSWSLVLAWPVTAALAVYWWPAHIHSLSQASDQIQLSAWLGLAYVAVCSTWLGFFLWYAALAQDAMRVSQLQLLQPLLAMLISAGVLGEAVPMNAWLFAVSVLVIVLLGQRMATSRPISTSSSLQVRPA